MPEPTVVTPSVNPQQGLPPAAFPDPASHNAEIARKLAEQDAAGHSTAAKPGEFEEATTALDKLAAAVPDPNAPKPGDDPAVKAAAEKKAAEDAAAAEAKKAEDAKLAEAAKKAEDVFKNVPELPQGTSPKASESFAAIKARAAQEISARDTQISDLNKQLAELTQRASTPTTEQIAKEKELEDLRIWRAKMDVDFDPKFKEFDSKVLQDQEFIYAQLRKSPAVTEAVIDEIKKYGGPEKTNLSRLFEQMKDPTLQRIVESKISDITMAQYQKDQALSATKQNVSQYLKERETAFRNAVTAHTTATQSELNRMLGALDWFKEKAEDKEHTTFLENVKSQIAEALKDDSPQMRAILLTGFAQMCRLQEQQKSLTTRAETAEKELAAITEKYSKVKNASTSRLRESAAPPSGALPQPKPANVFTTPVADALDTLAKQVMDQRAAKGV